MYLTLTPVLVAILVVVVMLRLYPLAVRGLLATSARGAGATGFVALSRAARSSLTGVLPRSRSCSRSAWPPSPGWSATGSPAARSPPPRDTTGADVLIEQLPAGQFRRRAGDRRGPRHRHLPPRSGARTGSRAVGQPITVVAVDPAGYAAVVAGTPFAAFPAAKIGAAAGGIIPFGGTVPVLASPSAAAILGTEATQLTTLTAMGPFKVRVAGTLSDTPAQPGGGAFVVMRLQTLPARPGNPSLARCWSPARRSTTPSFPPWPKR